MVSHNFEFSNKLEFKLKQQTPMLHFQHGEVGATLRASEVKPKLDRFLIGQLGRSWLQRVREEDEKRKKRGVPTWLLGNSEALNYKMQIKVNGEPKITTESKEAIKKGKNLIPGTQISKSYFGNMAKAEKNERWEDAVRRTYKEAVIYDSEIDLKIICPIKGLRDYISDMIGPFFLLHNFGTRQDKGFGSFIDNRYINHTNEQIESLLCQYMCEPYYVVKSSRGHEITNYGIALTYISDLYLLLKSGLNYKDRVDEKKDEYFRAFIYQYMHNQAQPIGNEKAWMKKQDKTLIRGKHKGYHENERQTDEKKFKSFRYVRAMLGITDVQHWDNKKVKIGIKNEEKVVERFASPIVFKVINNTIYILPQKLEGAMYSREFHFKREGGGLDKGLSTPSKEEFKLLEFLDAFCDYILDISSLDFEEILKGRSSKGFAKGQFAVQGTINFSLNSRSVLDINLKKYENYRNNMNRSLCVQGSIGSKRIKFRGSIEKRRGK